MRKGWQNSIRNSIFLTRGLRGSEYEIVDLRKVTRTRWYTICLMKQGVQRGSECGLSTCVMHDVYTSAGYLVWLGVRMLDLS